MSIEEITRMAREAGFDEHETPHVKLSLIERFAALVAAAEREQCARVCDDLEEHKGHACAYAIRARGQT